jgi:hypothetical protein
MYFMRFLCNLVYSNYFYDNIFNLKINTLFVFLIIKRIETSLRFWTCPAIFNLKSPIKKKKNNEIITKLVLTEIQMIELFFVYY